MTRSSTKELFTPFKDPEQEFRSSRKLFKTLSLDELRSPIDLFSDLKENSEEEVRETMAKTMEQYMRKTRVDYRSGIILDLKGAIPSKTTTDTKVAIQEMVEYSKNGTMEHLGQELLKLLMDWLQFKLNSTILKGKSKSFAWCLIKVNSEANLVDVFTVGIPSLIGEGFTKETIHIEYEWRPPRCDICKFFGHIHDHYPNKVVSPPITNTLNVVTPTIEKTHVGFQTVGKKKKKKCKSKDTNG
nr:zinc knuckle CX2CX4HX4C [Tanacetum cinerariifolium]